MPRFSFYLAPFLRSGKRLEYNKLTQYTVALRVNTTTFEKTQHLTKKEKKKIYLKKQQHLLVLCVCFMLLCFCPHSYQI